MVPVQLSSTPGLRHVRHQPKKFKTLSDVLQCCRTGGLNLSCPKALGGGLHILEFNVALEEPKPKEHGEKNMKRTGQQQNVPVGGFTSSQKYALLLS